MLRRLMLEAAETADRDTEEETGVPGDNLHRVMMASLPRDEEDDEDEEDEEDDEDDFDIDAAEEEEEEGKLSKNRCNILIKCIDLYTGVILRVVSDVMGITRLYCWLYWGNTKYIHASVCCEPYIFH